MQMLFAARQGQTTIFADVIANRFPTPALIELQWVVENSFINQVRLPF